MCAYVATLKTAYLSIYNCHSLDFECNATFFCFKFSFKNMKAFHLVPEFLCGLAGSDSNLCAFYDLDR